MNAKQRLLAALDRRMPDRLPATTHHVQPYFMERFMGGGDSDDFFTATGLDAVCWADGYLYTECQRQDWHITEEIMPNQPYHTVRYTIHTPKGALTTVLQSNDQTVWVAEHLLKDKREIDLLADYMPAPHADLSLIAEASASHPEALLRGTIPSFDLFGQPGCFQDLSCLFGIERLILECYDDPQWVHEMLALLQKRKLAYIDTLGQNCYDVMELGGGDASTTVISPGMFREFVAPYDAPLIHAIQQKGIRTAYHTCGGMMPILEDIAAMGTNAMETFTPPDMGGDVDLAEAKRRIGDKVCMIGGFDQFHFFSGGSEAETRAEVRRCFEAAGGDGGFILSPSDHFFDADLKLLHAFADEVQKCCY